MSIQGLLEMSRQSFRALDAAMNTVGQNVANANTEGYVRRRVVMKAEGTATSGLYAQPPGVQATGAGVSLDAYERMRDALLQRTSWEMKSEIGGAEEDHHVMSALEGLFPIRSEGSLSSRLNDFWNGWSDLMDNPSDNGVRLALRSQAASLTSTFNSLDEEIKRLEDETQSALRVGITAVNEKLSQIADLNNEIAHATFRGAPNPEAEDQRDLLIAEVAEYVPLRVRHEDDGTTTLFVQGMTAVDGPNFRGLEADFSATPPRVVYSGTDASIKVPDHGGGKVSGWLRALSTALPDAISQLDDLASAIATGVNAIHTGGTTLKGNTGVDFFEVPPSGAVTAGNIKLSAAVLADAMDIAASQGDPTTGVNDSAIARQIEALRDVPLLKGNTETTEEFVVNLAGGIGAAVHRARAEYEHASAFTNHIEAMEKGVSGVSIEEEMTDLIQYQQSYQASARVLNTVQAMLDALFAI